MRWHDYVLERGSDLQLFWESHLASRKRDVLLVLAKGFDPRMCRGYEMLVSAGGMGRRDIQLIEFDEGPASPSQNYKAWVEHNLKKLESLVLDRGAIRKRPLAFRSPEGRRVESHSAVSLFQKLTDFSPYTDVVLDISAMPRSVCFPLIGKILHLLDDAKGRDPRSPPLNFHLLVGESPELDDAIREEGVEDDASYVHPFTGGLDRESSAEQPKIWMPLLGEGQRLQFERIYGLVLPDEICPVLPSPARNPRRSDDLVVEYRDLLFDRLLVEPRNFIYAAEQNPFEVYRQIAAAIMDYKRSLGPLGGAKFVLSSLSSKLMSVGALLVAYEMKSANIAVGMAHVGCHGYIIDEVPARAALQQRVELFRLWLAGEYNC